MQRRSGTRRLAIASSDEEGPLVKKKAPSPTKDDSSSESDIESYLQPIDKIDLSSSFFNPKSKPTNFDEIENGILSGVKRIADSSSDEEILEQPQTTNSKLNFKQLHEYSKKLEEAKKHVEEYKAKKQAEMTDIDILNLLGAGESNLNKEKEAVLADFKGSLHSSDFESCSDSEKEGWEEVKAAEDVKKDHPQEGLQITVEFSDAKRKKKGVDWIAVIKRRYNRVRKENQIFIHKVHLLCWIAHGNYLNAIINNENILASALSLLPSQQCYPENRTDLKYLEQIVKWYKNAVPVAEREVSKDGNLEDILYEQMSKKRASNRKILVLIFIAILRSLGIQSRLVLSFQVEPLRPPISQLYTVSNKNEEETQKASTSKDVKNKTPEKKKTNTKVKIVDTEKPPKKVTRSTSKERQEKSKIKNEERNAEDKAKTRRSSNRLATKQEQTKIENKTKPKDNKSKAKAGTSTSTQSNEEKHKVNITKSNTKGTKETKHGTQKETKSQSKNLSTENPKNKKNLIKIKLPKPQTRSVKSAKNPQTVPQLDGLNDESSTSDEEIFFIPQIDGANDNKASTSSKPNLRKLKKSPVKTIPKQLKQKITKYKDTSSEDEFVTRSPFSQKKQTESPKIQNQSQFFTNNNKKSMDVRSDIIQLVKGRISDQKEVDRSKMVRKRRSTQKDSDNDSDYVPVAVVSKKKRDSTDDFVPQMKVKKRVQVKKVLSSDSDDGKKTKKQGVDVWVEVYLEAEEKWISVDVTKGQVHCVNELYMRASHPVTYIVAWNNNNSLKDVTKRYCKNFNTATRKLRVDVNWWEATLRPFIGVQTVRDREEDEDLERQQQDMPLPTSISEYKNHPLYVLERHLLKFQAIYPPNAPTLGFVRKEAVYSRQCVYTLHSRDIWLKHAKVVKVGEQPYKIVKARPRWDKLSNKIVSDQMLEIFGPWQVEDYVPPTAENGVVPRNAFGNVELFKPCMLPKKTVHLKLPGLNKVAKRMNIDCAAAIVGFDFHGGWSHPTYDGFVVCEEFADILVAAWELDQEEMEKREQEKIDKRVYGNWKRLIRGLLIRERLQAKYEFDEGEASTSKGKKMAKGLPKFATKKR